MIQGLTKIWSFWKLKRLGFLCNILFKLMETVTNTKHRPSKKLMVVAKNNPLQKKKTTSKKMKVITKKRIFIIIGLCLLLFLSIPFYVKYQARHKIFANVENVKNKEFAIVLGAAIKNNNKPGNFLKYRLDDAITLYKAGKIKKILISGDNGEDAHDEISVMNNYLVEKGIPQDIIFGDYAGFDTYSTMERADKIFDIKSAIIVSQGFHLPRAIYIANEKGIDATGYASKQSYGKRRYFIREHFATIKSFFDCTINRKAKYYGKKENTNRKTNINIEQLK